MIKKQLLFKFIWYLLQARDILISAVALVVLAAIPLWVIWHFFVPNFGADWDIFHPHMKSYP